MLWIGIELLVVLVGTIIWVEKSYKMPEKRN